MLRFTADLVYNPKKRYTRYMSDENVTDKPQPLVKVDSEINFFASTNFRNQNRKFGIKLDDRRRHMYVVGKTGMGKTTLLENMVLNDIYGGHGIGLVDPHGDFAEKVIDYIPSNRINDVVYFNPADINYPIGFNILETIRPEQKHLVASGLMGVFKKIWPDVWSARMEYILNNTILALLDFPGTTLLGINRMLSDAEYRKRVVNNTEDPVVKAFWQTEFANYTEKFRTEAVAPIQNKIGQFLSASVIRNIVAQVKSRINIREIMDERKIFIMNLSKGRIGEDNSRLLGGMLITRIQLAAMERVDIAEKNRKDFFLYVDEFQNFATESFANILSEARKYRLDLIMAHQYMEQLEEEVLAAVIGNVGTMVTFRVGSSDAEILAKEFTPTFVEEDLVNLPKFQVYLKLMIDGVASRPFSATTLGPIAASTASTEKVVRVSRERYATPREKIEEKIMRWSGLVPMTEEEAARLDIDDEDATFKAPAAKPAPPPVVTLQKNLSSTPRSTPATSPPAPRPAPAQAAAATPAWVAPPVAASAPVSVNVGSATTSPRPPAPNAGQPGVPSAPGEGKRKRKRKRKSGNLNPSDSTTVLLGDPNQQGISLSQVLNLSKQNSPSQPSPKPTMQTTPPSSAAQTVTVSQTNVTTTQASVTTLTPPQIKTEPAPAPQKSDDYFSPLSLDIPAKPDKVQAPIPAPIIAPPPQKPILPPLSPEQSAFKKAAPVIPPPNPPPEPVVPKHTPPKTLQPGTVEKID